LLSYPAAIPAAHSHAERLADLIRRRRRELRGRWRRLNPGAEALLVLAHLGNGDTYTRLVAGFAIGTSTAWRYVRETVDLLAAWPTTSAQRPSGRPGWRTRFSTARWYRSTESPNAPGPRWFVDGPYDKVTASGGTSTVRSISMGRSSSRSSQPPQPRFFQRALSTLKVVPVEAVTDAAAVYPACSTS
jgi:hypothetical protein